MLLRLKDETLTRIGPAENDPVPEYGVWQAQEPRPSAVQIPNDVNLMAEEFDPSGLELIVLEFPKFKDGRAYSQARILRERYGFAGDIRATGEVLRDQVLFMARCGITSFELSDEADTDGFQESLGEFDLYYQSAVNGTALWRQRLDAGSQQGGQDRRIA